MTIYSQPAACPCSADGTIQRSPQRLWMSDSSQKQAMEKAAWVTFSTDIVVQMLTYYVHFCLYAERQDFTPIMSLYSYSVGRFYTMLVIKYLMASFYATGSGIKCIIISSTLNALHIKI